MHHVYFGVRHAPPVFHVNALFLLLLFCECSSLLVLRLAPSFSLIFFSELVSLLVSRSLVFMFIIYESYFISWLAVELEEKKFLAYSGANEILCRLRHIFCMSCRYCSHYELVDYAHIMTSFKYLRVSIVPLRVSCIVFSIASIILW